MINHALQGRQKRLISILCEVSFYFSFHSHSTYFYSYFSNIYIRYRLQIEMEYLFIANDFFLAPFKIRKTKKREKHVHMLSSYR